MCAVLWWRLWYFHLVIREWDLLSCYCYCLLNFNCSLFFIICLTSRTNTPYFSGSPEDDRAVSSWQTRDNVHTDCHEEICSCDNFRNNWIKPGQFMLCPRVPARCFLTRVTMRGMTGPGGFSVTGKSFARSPAPRVASRRTELTKLSHPARTMHNGKLRGKNAMIDCPVSLSK